MDPVVDRPRVETDRRKGGKYMTCLEKTISKSNGNVENDPLARLGLEPSTRQELSLLQIMATGWNICNSWAAVAATLAMSIASGGPVTLLYGIVLVFVLGGSAALTMAEVASVYPTAGGQYHWTSILAPYRISRGLSYWCGIINTFGWIASCAGFIAPFPAVLLSLVSFWRPDYVREAWHVFLIFQSLNLLLTAYNPFCLSILAFLVFTVTCLAMSDSMQSSTFVWTEFQNTSRGFPDGVVFLVGLVNPHFLYSGLDGAIHLAEECTNAAVAVPRALVSTVVIGFVTGWTFAIAMCYSYHDFDAVLASGFPALEIFYQATSSRAVATLFTILFLTVGLFAIVGAQQTASRLTCSLARDDALVLSKYLSRVDHRWHIPVLALLANCFCVSLLGCVPLGSTSAFNALVSTGLILSQLSYAFLAALMLYHRVAGTMQQVMPCDKTRFQLSLGVCPVAKCLDDCAGAGGLGVVRLSVGSTGHVSE